MTTAIAEALLASGYDVKRDLAYRKATELYKVSGNNATLARAMLEQAIVDMNGRSHPISADRFVHVQSIQSDHEVVVRRNPNEQDHAADGESPAYNCPAQPVTKSDEEHQREVDRILAKSPGTAMVRATGPTASQKEAAIKIGTKLARLSLYDTLKLDSKAIRFIRYRELNAYVKDGRLASVLLQAIGHIPHGDPARDKLIPELISEDRLRIANASIKRLTLEGAS